MAAADRSGRSLRVNRLGGAFSIHFTEEAVTDYQGAQSSDDGQFRQFFKLLLEQGIYIAPSKYEVWFVTTAHTEQDIAETARAVDKTFAAMV